MNTDFIFKISFLRLFNIHKRNKTFWITHLCIIPTVVHLGWWILGGLQDRNALFLTRISGQGNTGLVPHPTRNRQLEVTPLLLQALLLLICRHQEDQRRLNYLRCTKYLVFNHIDFFYLQQANA